LTHGAFRLSRLRTTIIGTGYHFGVPPRANESRLIRNSLSLSVVDISEKEMSHVEANKCLSEGILGMELCEI